MIVYSQSLLRLFNIIDLLRLPLKYFGSIHQPHLISPLNTNFISLHGRRPSTGILVTATCHSHSSRCLRSHHCPNPARPSFTLLHRLPPSSCTQRSSLASHYALLLCRCFTSEFAMLSQHSLYLIHVSNGNTGSGLSALFNGFFLFRTSRDLEAGKPSYIASACQ